MLGENKFVIENIFWQNSFRSAFQYYPVYGTKKKIFNEGGIQGLGIDVVNTNSLEFKYLQEKIIEASKKQSKKEVLENNLLSLRFQMESYLLGKDEEIIEVGYFLKELVKVIKIKNKVFAEYIGSKESNLSALYNGTRKISIDLALKLGRIFRIDPTLWIHIQSKNELMKMKEENERKYHKYNIDDLLKKAS